MNKTKKNTRGITLITLVITIIVLLILAGVTIAALSGDNGILTRAKEAKEKKVGARALRSIIEDFMLDIMYEIPKDDNIGMVTITKDYVEKKGGPLITMRGCAAIEEKPAI